MSAAEDRETCIEYVVGDKYAYYTAGEKRLANKLLKQAEKFPDQVEILAVNPNGSVHARIPIGWFRYPCPKRIVSEKQRENMRMRAGEYGFTRKHDVQS